jgi:hypothetical protein
LLDLFGAGSAMGEIRVRQPALKHAKLIVYQYEHISKRLSFFYHYGYSPYLTTSICVRTIPGCIPA